MRRVFLVAGVLSLIGFAGCGGDDPTPAERNVGPTAQGITADKTELGAGETVELTAEASDPDGDELIYDWKLPDGWTAAAGGASSGPDAGSMTSDAGGTTGGPDESGPSGKTVQVTAPDEYEASGTVSVEVSDSFGVTTSAEIDLSTTTNVEPTIDSLDVETNPVEPGGTTSLTAEASDENGDELNYEWRAPREWTFEETDGGSATLTAPDKEDASTVVELVVTDGYGGEATAQLTVETTLNRRPFVQSVRARPVQPKPGETVTLTVTADDPDGDELSYEWSGPMEWGVDGSGAEVQTTAPDTYGAEATFEVTVSDGNGGERTADLVVTTVENNGPVISSVTANPSTVEKGGTIELSVSASDPNGDALTYEWSAPMDWTFDSMTGSTGKSVKLQAPAKPGESGLVELTVKDDTGAEASGSVVVSTAQNRAPVVQSVSATPTQASPGDTIDVTASVSDPDGDSLGYSWKAMGNWNVSGSGDSVEVTAPDQYGATTTVTVTVDDPHGGSAVGQVAVSTAANVDPVVSALTASPNPTSPGGTTKVTADVKDANGDSLTYNWTTPSGWSKSGSGDEIELTAPGSYGASGTVILKVDDGYGGEATGQVRVTTARNSGPVISSLTASPQIVSPGGTVTVDAAASDPDGDSLSYNWTGPNNWTLNGSGATVSLDAPNQRGQSGTVEVVVDDGNGASTRATTTVQTTPNQPPVINDITAELEPVPPSGSTKITVDADDPQGASLSYSYSVSSNDWSVSGNGDEATVDVSKTDGDKQTVTVTVDGSGGTVTGTIDLEVGCTSGYTVTKNGCKKSYDVSPGNWLGQRDSCSSGDYYNDCGADFGFEWDDKGLGEAAEVTVDVNHGISCQRQTVNVELNSNNVDTYQVPDRRNPYRCTCSPATSIEGVIGSGNASAANAYEVGATNKLWFRGVRECTGLSRNGNWNNGIARVEVVYQ